MKFHPCHGLLAVGLLFVTACGDDPENTSPNATTEELYPDGCDPIVSAAYCGYPSPSDVWTVPDESTPSGRRVRYHRTRMMPPTYAAGGDPVYQDPTLYDDFDGFSPGSQALFALEGATLAGTAPVTNVARSLEDDSPVVLLDATTGERVPHFVEVDPRTQDPAEQVFQVRPVIRLRSATRYVVAVRGLVDASGAPVQPTEPFRALRDRRRDPAHPSIAHRRAHYEELFAFLEDQGVARGDLQLVWDFTTSSDQHNTRRLATMYQTAIAALGDTSPSYAITSSQDDVDAHVKRRIEGTVHVPTYLTGDGGPGSTMVLGADGLPVQMGYVDVPFLLQIPTSAVGAGNAKPILQHGHGLFGLRTEGDGNEWRTFVDDAGYVLLSMDWWGLSEPDLIPASAVAGSGDVRDFRTVPDRGQQAMLNFLYGLRAAIHGLASDPATFVGGQPTIDPADPRYMGVSLGGIYGSVYLTLSPDIERGVLMVPGQPFGLLLPRNASTYPPLYYYLTEASLLSARNVPLALDGLQMLWDRVEPDGYAHLMLSDPQDVLPFAHDHRVFVMDAIGDKTVTTIGAGIMARTLGLPELSPAPRPLFGLTLAPGSVDGSAFAEFDFGPPESPTQLANETGGDPHGALIQLSATSGIPREMAANYLATGIASNLCSGSCDPN